MYDCVDLLNVGSFDVQVVVYLLFVYCDNFEVGCLLFGFVGDVLWLIEMVCVCYVYGFVVYFD